MEFDAIGFGMRIRNMRVKCNLTQEELAEATGMSRENIGRLERGVRTCSFEYLIRLSKVLHISTDYLLTGTQPDVERLQDTMSNLMIQLSNFTLAK